MRRTLVFILLPALIVTANAGQVPASPSADSILRVSFTSEPSSLNPLLSQNEAEGTIENFIFSRLLTEDPNGAHETDLAVAIPTKANRGISADGKTITIHLRRGVRWQDGAPFSASDVIFTYTAFRNPQVDVAVLLSNIASVSAPNPGTVLFKFKKLDADVLGNFTVPILPKHLLENSNNLNNTAFNTHPIGTGQYAFDDWQHGNSIELHANPYYYGRQPSIRRLRLMFVSSVPAVLMLKTGELDATVIEAGGISLLSGSPVRFRAFRRYSLQYVTLNIKRAPFDDVRVRRALELAIDRARLVETVYHGNAVAAEALVPPYNWGFDPVPVEQPDLARANALLDAAGWKRHGDGTRMRDGEPLEINMIFYTEQNVLRSLAVQLQAVWESLGVRVDLRAMPVASYVARSGPFRTGKYQAVLEAFGFPASPDRSFFIDTNSPFNDARYDDADVDRWNDAAMGTYDIARRRALYALIQRRVARDVPYIPIAWADTVVGYSDRLGRVVIPRASGVFAFLGDWSFRSPAP